MFRHCCCRRDWKNIPICHVQKVSTVKIADFELNTWIFSCARLSRAQRRRWSTSITMDKYLSLCWWGQLNVQIKSPCSQSRKELIMLPLRRWLDLSLRYTSTRRKKEKGFPGLSKYGLATWGVQQMSHPPDSHTVCKIERQSRAKQQENKEIKLKQKKLCRSNLQTK